MDINEIWRLIYDKLRQLDNKNVAINIHIKNAVPVSMDSSTYKIAVPNGINKSMIEFRFKNTIETFIEEITGNKLSLNIVLNEELDNTEDLQPEESPEQSSKYKINPKYTFENFVIGSSNEYATAAAISAAEKPGHIYNPLFLYGNSGLGKTHLMNAIGNRILQRNPSANVIYTTSENFTSEFITSVRENKGAQFRNKYRKADVLLVDDVQFMKKKEATQEEFFHTFNDLYNLNKQIVVTSDRPPGELTVLEERIRQRLAQGLPIDINVPDYETRVAILQQKASLHKAKIDNNVLEYIAERIKSNIRELEGILIKIISISELSHKEINIDLAEYVLKSYLPNVGIVTPDKIANKVSSFYNISKEALTSKTKTKNISFPRQVAVYLCYKLTDMNNVEIGSFFKRDRSTISYTVRTIENLINKDESFKSDINYIIKDLENS